MKKNLDIVGRVEIIGLDIVCVQEKGLDDSDVSAGGFSSEVEEESYSSCESSIDCEECDYAFEDSLVLARRRGVTPSLRGLELRLHEMGCTSTCSNSTCSDYAEDSLGLARDRQKRRNETKDIVLAAEDKKVSISPPHSVEIQIVVIKDLTIGVTPAPNVKTMRRLSIGNKAA
jgi:hypothetical protein